MEPGARLPMKINTKRLAISQSMDLFIIIAAVLAVGGIVTAAILGLGSAATSNQSIEVSQIAATGSSTAGSLIAFSITVKNNGPSSITGTLTVTLMGTVQPATPVTSPAPTAAVTSGSTAGTWTLGGAAGKPVVLSGASVTLAPGGQVAISEGSISGLTTSWTPGVLQTVSLLFGAAQISVTVTS
jgi:hypothetical protein